MLVVIALGGNALLRRGEPLDAAVQRANVKVAAEAIADVARDHRVVLTHGNGPQVGLLALQNEAYTDVAAYPLDVLDAETEGMVGYLLEQELGRHLARDRLATLLTQVVVDPDDPAFANPTKFVGPVYDGDAAHALIAHERGWAIAPDGDRVAAGRPLARAPTHRRARDHPDPRRPRRHRHLRRRRRHPRRCRTVAADCAASRRSSTRTCRRPCSPRSSTPTPCSCSPTSTACTTAGAPRTSACIRRDHARVSCGRSTSPAGSMGPKVEAVCRFVEAGGSLGAIGTLSQAAMILDGQAGTIVRHHEG